MNSRLEITTETDARYTIQSEDDDWKAMLINLIDSVTSSSGESGHIRSRLKITTDRGSTIMESEGSGWAEIMIRFMNGFSTGAKPPQKNTVSNYSDRASGTLSVRERLEAFLKYEYPRVWFTSQDIKNHYERVYDHINLSTASTYLSRMHSQKILERRGGRTQREYRLAESAIKEIPENVSECMPKQTLPILQSVN